MKKYITTISLVLNVILVTLFFFFYNSFKVVNDLRDVKSLSVAKHNSITNDVALNVIFGKIDSNFNLILTTITVLFTLFVFLTFFGVKEQFTFQLSSIKKKIRVQQDAWTEHKTELLSIKGDLSFEVAEKIGKDIKELNILNRINPETKWQWVGRIKAEEDIILEKSMSIVNKLHPA